MSFMLRDSSGRNMIESPVSPAQRDINADRSDMDMLKEFSGRAKPNDSNLNTMMLNRSSGREQKVEILHEPIRQRTPADEPSTPDDDVANNLMLSQFSGRQLALLRSFEKTFDAQDAASTIDALDAVADDSTTTVAEDEKQQ